MSKKYSLIQVRMLLALHKGQLTKTDLSARYRAVTISERDQFIQELVDDKLVEGELRPTPNSRRTPVFYFLTEAGKKWVAKYLESLKRGSER